MIYIDYVVTQLQDASDEISDPSLICDSHNTLVLIMSDAFDGLAVDVKDTRYLVHHGEYIWNVN